MEIKNKNLKVRVSQSLYNELLEYCEYRGFTLSSAIRLAVEKLLYEDGNR